MHYEKYDLHDLTNKFVVNASVYMGYIDDEIYDTELTIFNNDEFDMIIALITICQDIDTKRKLIHKLVDDYLNEPKESLTPYYYCQKEIDLYFKHYFDIIISEVDAEIILDKIKEFMPQYDNGEEMAGIEIIKDNEIFAIADPTPENIQEAVEFIINNLDKLDIYNLKLK